MSQLPKPFANWNEVQCGHGVAPWTARIGRWLTLFVQPYYGSGIRWKGIIQHPDWTFTLKHSVSDMFAAMVNVEAMAKKLMEFEDDRSIEKEI